MTSAINIELSVMSSNVSHARDFVTHNYIVAVHEWAWSQYTSGRGRRDGLLTGRRTIKSRIPLIRRLMVSTNINTFLHVHSS